MEVCACFCGRRKEFEYDEMLVSSVNLLAQADDAMDIVRKEALLPEAVLGLAFVAELEGKLPAFNGRQDDSFDAIWKAASYSLKLQALQAWTHYWVCARLQLH